MSEKVSFKEFIKRRVKATKKPLQERLRQHEEKESPTYYTRKEKVSLWGYLKRISGAGMSVGALIGIMIAIVVGVSIIPAITSTVDKVVENNTAMVAAGIVEPLSEGIMRIADILTYVLVAVVIIGAVAWVGARSD